MTTAKRMLMKRIFMGDVVGRLVAAPGSAD